MFSTRIARLSLAAVLLGGALMMFGCGSGAATSQQLAPGSGSSMADQLYNVLTPVPGEGISVDINQAETDQTQYLVDRLQSAKDTHAELFKGMQYETNVNGTGDYGYTFQDGSRMVWVSKPANSGSQRTLDHVEITRP